MRITKVLFFFCALMLTFNQAADANTKTPLASQKNVKAFINNMVKQHGFDKKQLTHLFNQVKIKQDIIDKISTPLESKPWHVYRPYFLTDKRIQKGAHFWQQHQKTLDRAKKEYGVPPSVIVAILGVETYYGKQRGGYRVIDALSTLAFAYPPRHQYFTKELEQFLLFTKEDKIDPLKPLGSYAGAMGQPQFMPSSYRYYAVDYTGNGHRDLQNNIDDIIGSVANYLNKNGWQANQPIAEPATIRPPFKPLEYSAKPSYSLQELKNQGIYPRGDHPHDQLASFITLRTKTKPEYWLGFNNFYTITRYNGSKLYAMTIFQLGNAIQQYRESHISKMATQALPNA